MSLFLFVLFLKKKTDTDILKTEKRGKKTEQKVVRVETDENDLNKMSFFFPFQYKFYSEWIKNIIVIINYLEKLIILHQHKS